MKPVAGDKQPDIDIDISEYVAADQESDGSESFGEYVSANNQLPPVALKLIESVKAKRLSIDEASTGETETRKRSRSTSCSSSKHESDPLPTKHSRGRSSSRDPRINRNITPVFLQDPKLKIKAANLPESENENVDKNIEPASVGQ